MKSKIVISLVALVLAASAGNAANENPATAATKGKLHIEGSTTVGPIADGFAEAFKKMYPDAVITVNKSGSGTGATALIDSRCDIATMSRFMKDTDSRMQSQKAFYLLLMLSLWTVFA
jgi:ABC-type phosphate transport system substrate-binding protein